MTVLRSNFVESFIQSLDLVRLLSNQFASQFPHVLHALNPVNTGIRAVDALKVTVNAVN
jgi:hypothetical protein